MGLEVADLRTVPAQQFSSPHGVVLDGEGNIIITDYYNHRVRKITPHTVTTVLSVDG